MKKVIILPDDEAKKLPGKAASFLVLLRIPFKQNKFGGTIMSVQKQPLRRSKSNRIIAGVCGGLSEFFGISSFWIRLAFVVALIPGGVPGLLAYFLFWMIVPSE